MKKRNAIAVALHLKIFHNKIVRAKRGKGSYTRKNKHKGKSND